MGLRNFFGYGFGGSSFFGGRRKGMQSTKNKANLLLSPAEKESTYKSRFNVFSSIKNKRDPEPNSAQMPVTDLEGFSAAGAFGGMIDVYNNYVYAMEASKEQRLAIYREMAKYPEISFAVDQFVTEAVNPDEEGKFMDLIIKSDAIRKNDNIRKTITTEWNRLVYDIIKADEHVNQWFREFMVDGEIGFEKVIDNENPDLGIRKIKKLRTSKLHPIWDDLEIDQISSFAYKTESSILALPSDMVAYANSGFYEYNQTEDDKIVLSFLEPAKTTYKRLKQLEDALVIYRLCLDAESRIKTSSGYKYIKDIDVGDTVYSFDYKKNELVPTTVTKKWNNGVKDTVQIKSRHVELVCTKNHPILVKNKNITEYVNAGELTKEHQIIIPKFNEENVKTKIETNFGEKVANIPEFIDEDFARLFGFLIGNGKITKKSITFTVSKDINNLYSSLLRKYFGEGNSKSTIAINIFNNLGYKQKKSEKRIPNWVFNSSHSIKKSFIDGLSDGYGCERNTNNFITIQTSNKRLIEDIKEVWSSMNLSCNKVKSKTITLTYIPLEEYENIISIKPVGEREVYDIEVSSDYHNFIVNSIPVHNCRAPERRIFNIEVGSLPKGKAEQYVKDLMTQYRQRKLFDPRTGEATDNLDVMAMTEDYWFPVFNGGKQSTIDTLPGGENLGQMDDVTYFRDKMYMGLKVPRKRFESDTGFSLGDTSDITREEVDFVKQVTQYSKRFAGIFKQIFITQLELRGMVEEFGITQEDIAVHMHNNNLFGKFFEAKITELKFQRFSGYSDLINKEVPMLSREWVAKKILELSDDEWSKNQEMLLTEQAELAESGGDSEEP